MSYVQLGTAPNRGAHRHGAKMRRARPLPVAGLFEDLFTSGPSVSPSGVVTGDRPAMLQAQRSEARAHFGESSIVIPGRTAPGQPREPNLTRDYALKLLDYWIRDTHDVIASRGMMETEVAAWRTAVMSAYLHNGDTMHALRDQLAGQSTVNTTQLQQVWNALAQAAITSNAIATTPRPYQLMAEALAETLQELKQNVYTTGSNIVTLLKYGVVALVAVTVIRVFE